jgi:L-2-hydroxyglutarate oxidase LhgO
MQFVGGTERTLEDKIQEIYDRIYLQVDLVSENYSGVIKGIIVDPAKFEHVTSKLVSAFNEESIETLSALLDRLTASNVPYVHIQWLFCNYRLNDHLLTAVDTYFKREVSDIYTALSNIPQVRKELDGLVRATHKSKFAVKVETCKDKITSQSGSVKLIQIVQKIKKLHEIHESMQPIINEVYTKESELASKLVSIISSI